MEPVRATVLLVEDDLSILRLLELIFKKDYNVVTAENGKEALLRLNETPSVNLIISDIMMPEMDGIEFKENINKIPEKAKIPFIFLTAISDSQTKERGFSLGASEFLVKPIRPIDLLQSAKKYLS